MVRGVEVALAGFLRDLFCRSTQIFADVGVVAHVARPVCRQPESAGSIGSPGLAGPAADALESLAQRHGKVVAEGDVGGRRIEDAEPLVLEIRDRRAAAPRSAG
jgi:hypothetical protein